MFKIIFWIFIGYMICSTNSCSAMKEYFVYSGAKEMVIEKIEDIK
jgi:hypothetical protein